MPDLTNLTDVKAHLNITSTVHDDELQGFIAATTPIIENITGPVNSNPYTEWHDGGRDFIVVDRTPVLAVTSITEYAGVTPTTLTLAATPDTSTDNGYTVDLDTGIVRRVSSSGYPYRFPAGTRNIQIVYTAGYSSVPSNIRMAALELVRVLYDQSQLAGGTAGRAFSGDSIDANEPGIYIMGFFVPNRVREMLVPNQRGPVVA